MQAKSSSRLAAWLATQAALSSLAGASAMTDTLGPKWSGLFFAIISACNVGTAAWVAATRPVESAPPGAGTSGYPA